MHVIADGCSFVLDKYVHKVTLSQVYCYQVESMNSWDQLHSFHTPTYKNDIYGRQGIFLSVLAPTKNPGP